jgi:hypothetical protein
MTSNRTSATVLAPALIAREEAQGKLAQHALRAALASARTIRAQAAYSTLVTKAMDEARGMGAHDADIHTTAHIKARQIAIDAFMAEQETLRALAQAVGREANRQREAGEPI